MRVLVVALGIPSPIGQIHLHTILPHLAGEHDVHIVCFDNNAEFSRAGEVEGETGARVSTVPFRIQPFVLRAARALARGVPLAVATHASRHLARAVREAQRGRAFDIVLVEQMALAPYARFVKKAPVALFPVDCVSRLKDQLLQSDPRASRRIDLALTRRFERRSYAKSDGVLFVSKVDAEYAIRHGLSPARRTHIVPNGVDIDYFRPRTGFERAGEVLFFGNLSNPSNQQAAFWFHRQVWPAVRDAQPSARLVIAGNAPSRELVALQEKDRTVAVRGFVPDLRPLLHTAAVVVSPLRIGTGMKNRMLQAMACAKAIVATPLSADGLDIEDGRHLRIASDAPEFVSALLELLDDPGARKILGRAAREHVEAKFSIRVSVQRFAGVLEGIAATGRNE